MTSFNKNDVISIEEMDIESEQYFILFCMGIIKALLDKLTGEYKDKFDIVFFDGGCGGDGFEIIPKGKPNTCICFGTAGGTLGGNSYTDCEMGEIGNYSVLMSTNKFTINELENFLIESLDVLFDDKKIEEILKPQENPDS